MPTTPERHCGGCTLCCKLLAVRELGKLAGERCRHQSFTGCKVYFNGRMPMSCRVWNCRWITGSLPRDMRRPDRAHYVIDMVPDYTKVVNNATGATFDLPVIQIWCDPAHPRAHEDPALRAWLDAERICGLVRYSAERAKLIAPPSVNEGGVWWEQEETECNVPSHSLLEILQHTGATIQLKVEA